MENMHTALQRSNMYCPNHSCASIASDMDFNSTSLIIACFVIHYSLIIACFVIKKFEYTKVRNADSKLV